MAIYRDTREEGMMGLGQGRADEVGEKRSNH